MINFKRIVLTTDLSDNANEAVPYAIDVARKYDGVIELLHVCEDTAYYAGAAAAEGFVVDLEDFTARINKDRDLALKKRAAEHVANFGVQVTPVLRKGHPANEILSYAKEANPDLLVIATHGRTGLSHLVFGSIAERVIRSCSCPVLSVRPAKMKA